MRPIDQIFLDDKKGLALLTAREIVESNQIMLADFRDTHALVYKKTGHFIGLSLTRGIRLGGHPIQMIDGVWYITEDPKAQKGHENASVTPDMLAMGLIK